MYVEMRIPAKQTHPYPIIMVHGGTRSGTNFTGTPDGRESWAQYFARRGYAVYVVDQPGAAAPAYVAGGLRPAALRRRRERAAALPAAGEVQAVAAGAPAHAVARQRRDRTIRSRMQMVGSFLPEIATSPSSRSLNRDALVALLDKIGPSILLVHSQAGAFGWPVADARPDLVKAIVAVEPNGPPVHGVEFVGAPEWFKEGPVALRLRHHVGAARLSIRR